jgi:holo-[acyl-carrier protein] synthase
MMIKTGIDLIEVDRIDDAIKRHGERFLNRIFTPGELLKFRENTQSLAARWAAKEAVAKTISTGIGDIEWTEIEILHGPNKEPKLTLYGNAKKFAEEQNLTSWSLSLSHTREHAIAMVIATQE